jgi:hypothetical protein
MQLAKSMFVRGMFVLMLKGFQSCCLEMYLEAL